MTDLRTAAQRALEAMKSFQSTFSLYEGEFDAEIAALKAALVEDAMQKFTDVNQELEAALAEPDLSRCPQCGGPADNGHDRCIPPNSYFCTKCMAEPVQEPDPWGAGYEAGYAAGMEEVHAEPVQKPLAYRAATLSKPSGSLGEDVQECSNCASLEAQNTELDRKLAEMERKPLNEFDALRLITTSVGLLKSAEPVEGLLGIIRAVERAHGIGNSNA